MAVAQRRERDRRRRRAGELVAKWRRWRDQRRLADAALQRGQVPPGLRTIRPNAATRPCCPQARPPLRCALLNGHGRRMSLLLLLVQAAVDRRDLVDEALPVRVLEREDLVERPVEVVGHVRDLLVEPFGCVRQDPPRRSPAISTVNSWLHAGQVTAAWLMPSWLTRLYRSCRNARSDANMFSMIPGCTSPSSTQSRDDARQEQYGQVRLVLAHSRVAQRDDLVLGRGEAHHALAMDRAARVDVTARQDEREFGPQRRQPPNWRRTPARWSG